jgi:hypothetical protein
VRKAQYGGQPLPPLPIRDKSVNVGAYCDAATGRLRFEKAQVDTADWQILFARSNTERFRLLALLYLEMLVFECTLYQCRVYQTQDGRNYILGHLG